MTAKTLEKEKESSIQTVRKTERNRKHLERRAHKARGRDGYLGYSQ